MLAGSLGMLPSASLGETAPGLYEPSHGSAPKYAGLDKANPIATILSVSMMFRYSLNLPEESKAIEDAVDAVLAEGWHTYDIPGDGELVGTKKDGPADPGTPLRHRNLIAGNKSSHSGSQTRFWLPFAR